jgi:hypothetical protein
MPGDDWGFVACTNNGSIEAPPWLSMNSDRIHDALQKAQAQKSNLLSDRTQKHANYWASNSPGSSFEHWRFQYGYDLGWSDAVHFYEMRSIDGGPGSQGGDKIGLLEVWILKRIVDAGQTGEFVWEFEQGFRQGVADFYATVGI